jgi:hypothetical protein
MTAAIFPNTESEPAIVYASEDGEPLVGGIDPDDLG